MNEYSPLTPFREPLARARSRADIIICVGQNPQSAQAAANQNCTPLAAWLEPTASLQPKPVVAFSGIGRPTKFFDLLQQSDFDIVHRTGFPDHHPFYSSKPFSLGADCTHEKCDINYDGKKTHVRIPVKFQDMVEIFPVQMHINDPNLLLEMIQSIIDQSPSAS